MLAVFDLDSPLARAKSQLRDAVPDILVSDWEAAG